MAKMDHKYPIWEEYPPESEGFSAPCEEAEFYPPDTESEFSPPPRPDYANPDPDREFDPPGRGSGDVLPPNRRRHKWKRLLLVAAGCLLLAAARLIPSADHNPLLPGTPLTSSAPAASIAPQPSSEPAPELTPEPTAEPVPISNVPVITTDFFCFPSASLISNQSIPCWFGSAAPGFLDGCVTAVAAGALGTREAPGE